MPKARDVAKLPGLEGKKLAKAQKVCAVDPGEPDTSVRNRRSEAVES